MPRVGAALRCTDRKVRGDPGSVRHADLPAGYDFGPASQLYQIEVRYPRKESGSVAGPSEIGIVTVKIEPCLRTLLTTIVAPSAIAFRCTTARPRPIPRCFRMLEFESSASSLNPRATN